MRGSVIALVCLSLAAPLAAQEAAPAPPTSRDLQRINATLERIASLLVRQVETQELDLAFKRVELAQSLESQTEDALDEARGRKRSAEEELFHLGNQLKWIESEAESGEMSADDAERMLDQVEGMEERIEERMAEADRQILELENELAGRRRATREWQQLVDRRLAAATED